MFFFIKINLVITVDCSAPREQLSFGELSTRGSVVHAYLHLCEGVVALEVGHAVDVQLQVQVVAFEVMRTGLGLVVSWKDSGVT